MEKIGDLLKGDRASQRWAGVVLAVVRSEHDTRSVADWAELTGLSPSTLRSICARQGTLPKATLTFGRLLRLVARRQLHNAAELLEADGIRTIQGMLARSGVPMADGQPQSLTLADFLRVQLLVRNERGIDVVLGQLADPGSPTTT